MALPAVSQQSLGSLILPHLTLQQQAPHRFHPTSPALVDLCARSGSNVTSCKRLLGPSILMHFQSHTCFLPTSLSTDMASTWKELIQLYVYSQENVVLFGRNLVRLWHLKQGLTHSSAQLLEAE